MKDDCMGRRIDSYCAVANELIWGKSARKIIASPKGSELSFSTGTFLNNYDVIERKLQPFVNMLDCRKMSKKNARHYSRDYSYNC